METGEGNYLANLAPYPGRNEFFRYLPEQTQAVLLCPLGKEGVVVFASDTQRGFGPLDQVRGLACFGGLGGGEWGR